ncbi:hypothetical protein PZB74_11290 [Porifericola rhodea]|uniref:hypothetical protein n=1 Tax=Porifericola rhodea TaxID=930972 RepID=UPI002666361D|nr:hypothetical protein [Porifericola rhodea]WKN29547.1 hypothetical protein PZB74_11290 [Porifericola rhodea]
MKPKEQINYIYDHCRLVDFQVVREQYRTFGICLYHNGQIFIEVSFDGLQGDRVRQIKAYESVKKLAHWYERIDIKEVIPQKI